MFDIGWSELAVIGVVALVVIGPKDLPKVLRTVGMWVRKARTVASEFQSSIDQMAREAELADMKKQIEEASKLDIRREIEKAVDPDNTLAKSLDVDPLTPLPPDIIPDGSAPAQVTVANTVAAEAPQPPVETFEPLPAAAEPVPVEVKPVEPVAPKQGTTDRA